MSEKPTDYSQMKFELLITGLSLLLLTACNKQEEVFVQTVQIPEGYTLEQKVELSAKVVPHPRQMKWFEDEFFGFIHYGPNTYSGREWGTGFEDATLFQPGDLNTDQWCELMAAAGIKRVVMVAKHHDGYCLWPSRYTSHSVAASPWKEGQGDVIRELANSCEKYGLRLGIYLSPADLYQIENPEGVYGNGSAFSERTIPTEVAGRPFTDQRTFSYVVDDYNAYFLNQLFELLTEYGAIYEVWFDGAHPKPGTGQAYNYDAWFDLIRNLAPDAVIFGKGPDARWCGNEGGATREAEYNIIPLDQSPETYHWPDKMENDVAGRAQIKEATSYFHYYPAETNTSIRHGWFWRNEDEQQVRQVDDVFDMYERSVGGNSVLHLNIPPNPQGQFSRRDAEVLEELGKRIRAVYGTDLLEGGSATSPKVLDGKSETYWEAPEKTSTFEVQLPKVARVNRFVLQEAIAQKGERVEAHHLEAWLNGKWERVAEAKTIGHKRILRFPVIETDQFRVVITEARLAPSLMKVSAHYYDEPPKSVVLKSNEKGHIVLGVGTSFDWNNHGMTDLSQDIYYTLDGSEPTSSSAMYSEPLVLPLGGHLKARAIVGHRKGVVTEMRIGLAKEGWTAVDQDGNSETASLAVDGNRHSSWISSEITVAKPSLTIDMKRDFSLSGLAYRPAVNGGYIEAFDVEVSLDGQTWKKIHSGEFGNIRNDPGRRIVMFDKVTNARFVRLSRLVPPGGFTRVGAAEIDLLSE